MLVLILVIGALLGVLVLWFTLLRHERAVRHRAGRRPVAQPSMIGASGTAVFSGGGGAEVSDGDIDQDAAPADGGADADGGGGGGEADSDDDADADEQDTAEEPEPAAESESGPESKDESEPEQADEPEPEPADEPASRSEQSAPRTAKHRRKPAKGQRRKLTDDILTRVEAEIAERETWRYKDLAALVHSEFGVAVHPSTIQRAIKRRRAETADAASAQTADPAAASASA